MCSTSGLSLKVWGREFLLSFYPSPFPSARITDMMVAASVDQVTKGHTQGWRGHRLEGICMPLPTAVETSVLTLRHTLWTVTRVCLRVYLS